MSEHHPMVDGITEARPMVVLQFFSLVVEEERLGNPRVTARFEPGAALPRGCVWTNPDI
ncbi:hypothetical protein OIE68_16810 [Nocardia vinacea]|uniref:hypothetical protein n=1 Tax=Nocardia vinacea TaxID=96468 RepID=UPI002E11C61A|nr:hypothetical protein OIE68_16810 [Nocardia vinacea]